MIETHLIHEHLDFPADRPTETLDVRAAGPPEPLVQTLELLAELPDDVVVIQRNDRAPQFLYPKLEGRGYQFETVDTEDETITAIWVERQ